MAKSQKPITCKGCGLCCVSLYDQDVFCDITETDYTRFTKSERKHVKIPMLVYQLTGDRTAIKTKWRMNTQGPLRKYETCNCYFLRGSLLRNATCSIYDRRPMVCKKAVKPGDRTCRFLRTMYENKAFKDPEKIESTG